MTSFSLIVLGRGGPSLAAYGIGSMSLFAFLLTIQVLHGKSEIKDDFVKRQLSELQSPHRSLLLT